MVCANSKLKEAKPPIEIGVYMYYLQGSLQFTESACNGTACN